MEYVNASYQHYYESIWSSSASSHFCFFVKLFSSFLQVTVNIIDLVFESLVEELASLIEDIS